MLFAFCNIASATSYREPVDGIKINPGLNPVVKFIDGDKYEYTLYAYEMDGITNGDFSFIYTENIPPPRGCDINEIKEVTKQ